MLKLNAKVKGIELKLKHGKVKYKIFVELCYILLSHNRNDSKFYSFQCTLASLY